MSETPPLPPTPETNAAALEVETASQRIQEVLTALAADYPTDTSVDQQIFLEKFARAVKGLHQVARVVATGGPESIRLLCPAAGVPPEMAHKLYEILYYVDES